MIALVFGVFFSRSLTRPIHRAINNLSGTYSRFMDTADQIAATSHQLSDGTSKQAAAVGEASSITEALAAIVQRNSEDVQKLKNSSEESATVGFKTFELFRQAKKATKEIKLSIEETAKIVKTISEIAFQSSLLALSASIEAARTGEAGIGFSVVAEEVRNLANRSTEAAKNTSALIEETVKLIARGDDLVRSSMRDFIAYGEGSTPITGFTQTAFEVAQKQAQGIEQITTALAEISLTAQNNASIAEESTAVAEEINAQAHNMAIIVEELKRIV
jgi:methyl-accepting chemotaxis protein